MNAMTLPQRIMACSVDGCDRLPHRRGMCSQHYQRFMRSGTPTGTRPTLYGEPQAWLDRNLTFTGDECLIWPFCRRLGRASVTVNGRPKYAARVVCERVHGAPPSPAHVAAHSCGKGHEGCVNPRHLRWATEVENSADKVIHGTDRRGERSPNAKLTQAQALDAYRRAWLGERQVAIAAELGVDVCIISSIKTGRLWASVTGHPSTRKKVAGRVAR